MFLKIALLLVFITIGDYYILYDKDIVKTIKGELIDIPVILIVILLLT